MKQILFAGAVLILSAAAYFFKLLPELCFIGILLVTAVSLIPFRPIPSLYERMRKPDSLFPKFLAGDSVRCCCTLALVFCSLVYTTAAIASIFPECPLFVNTCTIQLHDSVETGYTKRVIPQKECIMISGSFHKDTVVTGDGQKLRNVPSVKEVGKDTVHNNGAFLFVSKEVQTLQIRSPRKIVSLLSSPKWIFAVFLLIGLLLSIREIMLVPPERKKENGNVLLLFTAAALCSIFMMLPELFPLKYAVDGPHYLSLVNGDLLQNCLVSYRTPGYPLFLKFALLFSPADLSALIFLQYGLFFLVMIWLLWELKALGFPVFCCIVMELLFAKYMYCYHNFVLADSLNLTGVIGLLAISMLMLRKFREPGCPVIFKMILHISAMILVFLQLMIKPFPGTILIPAGMLFLGFAFRNEWKKAFFNAVLSAVLCVILPVLFCSYRYYRYQDFNFASLVSFQVASSAVLLMEKDGMNKLNAETRADVQSIITETLQQNPELVWPMNINDTKFTAETYETYANRIMYHPGLWNGSWLKKKDCRKYTSFELFLEFESRKLARKLFPLIDKQKFMQLRVIYIKELGNYLQYPRLCAYNFSENSPFRSARRCFWMLLVPLTLMILFSKVFYQKNSDFVMKKDLLQAFVMIAFLGAVSIFSTCILIAPYVEVRREMIGLFSILFGTFALLCYSVWFSFLTLYRFFTGSFLSGTTK